MGCIRNPGFELGDQDWIKPPSGVIEKDAANARSGLWVARLVESDFPDFISNTLQTRAGMRVSASLWAKQSADHDAAPRVRLQWRDKDGTQINQSGGTLITAGETLYLQSTATDLVAPARTKSVRVLMDGGNGSVGTVWFDDVSASGDIIEDLPPEATIISQRLIESTTEATFEPLVGGNKFSTFNAGMSDKWAGRWTFKSALPGGNLEPIQSWLRRLGKRRMFFAFNADRRSPQNGVVNGMVVDGPTDQGVNELPIRNGTANTTALREGDYIEVGSQYFALRRDLEIGPEGTGVAEVWPAIRTPFADGEDVITDDPKIVARVTSDIDYQSSATKVTEISISWEEVA